MKYKQLSCDQRLVIECMLKNNISVKKIAKSIDRAYSTVYREINRNKHYSKYSAGIAEEKAYDRRTEGHVRKFFSKKMERIIRKYMTKEQWSPQQIIGWCKNHDIEMVCHETIYNYIFVDKEKGGTLFKHLRTGHKKYKKRYGKKDRRGQIIDKVSIELRPMEANNRERFGDWEADLIVGKEHKGAILTMVERTTGYLIMRKTDGKKSLSVVKEMINGLKPYKGSLMSITNDNGKEFINHKKLSRSLKTPVFFCHPYASWERGLNEYTNKLIRQYIPKSIDLRFISSKKIRAIQNKLNRRPREKLNFKNPKEIFIRNLDQKLALAS